MKKEQLKQEIFSAISGEMDQWLEKSPQIKSGYEYEEQFITVMRKMSKIILQNSIGTVPSNRNKKNSTPVLESLK